MDIQIQADGLRHALECLREAGFVVVPKSLLTPEQLEARPDVKLVLGGGCWSGFGPYQVP